jgi:prepilin-type N-terminal cleavage/methylation domain-containing protein
VLKGYLGTKQFYASKRYSQENAGFSLVEVIAVVLMIGILAAIALPSWSAFVNRQRVNKANDAVLAVIQQAQTEAKKKKLSYSISFTTNSSQVVKVIAYPASSNPPTDTNDIPWQSLGGDLQIPNGAVLLGTNITSPNTSGTTSYGSAYNATNKSQTITFDYLGVLARKASGGDADTPLKVIVAAPNPGTTAASGLKRCVIMETLIGGMRTARDTECN